MDHPLWTHPAVQIRTPPPVAASAQTWTAHSERTNNRKEQIEETKKEKEEFNKKFGAWSTSAGFLQEKCWRSIRRGHAREADQHT